MTLQENSMFHHIFFTLSNGARTDDGHVSVPRVPNGAAAAVIDAQSGVKPPSCPNSPALWGGEKFQAPGCLSKQ